MAVIFINVGQETLGAVKAFFPVLKEQKMIGEFFRELDCLIVTQKKKCDELLKVKKALLQRMFC